MLSNVLKMKSAVRFSLFLCFIYLQQNLAAQRLPDTVRVSKQCSLIRELVTIGMEKHFAPIQLNQIGSTHGYMPNGTWEFATLRYDADLKWPGASRSYLENYTDRSPGIQSDTWQYIAEFTRLPNSLAATSMYLYLNRQIEGCSFSLNDSTEVDFRSLPTDSLPADRPAALETASIYGLPTLEKPTASTIHVMVGMEKRTNGYNVSLIVENVIKTNPVADKKRVASRF